eukprot:CAMPEP_0114413624 /NCGR_PEP_ID=MMETSP0103-20121206/954_1 /TAXON_ID=37642 ORGANISM="Paraphysomonas imperforata, Strain PA2" /NCGR_SAMPLE_ID=MMETSP0103 /ASSEMBLY_ACC=CAM_ASM_000201 /LENGTH=85 /DNA_ID=CAMNT_0001581711 /DNA_START=158 /DNA_END=412 /DNA_ORIENTATION=-
MRDIFRQAADKDSIYTFAIIRDPTDRFLSIYKYWKHGSDLYNRYNCRDVMVHDSRWCDMHTHPSVGSENITEMSAVSCRGDGDVS